MATVFSTTPIHPDQADRLSEAGHRLVVHGKPPIDRPRLLEAIGDADALLSLLGDRIDEEVLRAGRSLRIVANIAVGYENVDVEAARDLGIVVTNTPDVLTEATADQTFALLLAAARRMPEADASVRAGRFPAWRLDQPLLGLDVSGKTLGILGTGRIGSAVARRGRLGFGMRVLYHSRTRREKLEKEIEAEFVSLERLLAESDFLWIHVPGTEETRHLIDADALARMKPTAVLVNAARGSVVDEEALADALEAGTIAGAGLDVFEREPEVCPKLLGLTEHVALAPHLGSATRDTRHAMVRLAVDNVLAVLGGSAPITPVGVGIPPS
jgi:glyoxylate reductase